MRIAYVNGRYVPYLRAMVPMEDRGYQFADGLYEVAIFHNQKFLDWDLHCERLQHSLNALRIKSPVSMQSLRMITEYLLRRNPYNEGYIYMQITRGVARRNHPFPAHSEPSLTITVMPSKKHNAQVYKNGVKVICVKDERWARCDIKSISLLPNVLALQKAQEASAAEVFMFNAEDCLTESSRSSAFIVKDGAVHTHPENEAVLNGVRKQVLKRLCHDNNIAYHERMIPRHEVLEADEAFFTSATSHIMPVTRIDDVVLGDAKIGSLTERLLALYQAHVTSQTGKIW